MADHKKPLLPLALLLKKRWVRWLHNPVKVLLLGGVVAGVAILVLLTLHARPTAPKTDSADSEGALKLVHDSWFIRTYHFPDGSRLLFPGQRLVALYGSPDEPVLGVLGAQPMQASIDRVKALATTYQPLLHMRVMPALEIIATVASSSPTQNGDYSREQPLALLAPWVDAARRQGVYIVLDLQPGRSDFLTQAKQYEPLLQQPNVGLALDPEWRLKPDEVHLKQIGSVGIDEVNATAAWLASLVSQQRLPQKLFLLHEFRPSMLPERERLDTSHSELAYAIQMDGQGSQPMKQSTWRGILQDAPGAVHFGWKNFYTKDTPMLTPNQTAAIQPQPWYISYQ